MSTNIEVYMRMSHRRVLADGIRKNLLPSIGTGWFINVAQSHPDAQDGDCFLIRRDFLSYDNLVVEYLLKRVGEDWESISVCFVEGQVPPITYNHDASRHLVEPVFFDESASSASFLKAMYSSKQYIEERQRHQAQHDLSCVRAA